jgi:DNA-binding transcriptional ArsR family regulator
MPVLPQPQPPDFDLATVLHALGDPTRLLLCHHLAHHGESTCLPPGLTVPRSTLSNHWRILREAGVVSIRTQGKSRLITLRREELDTRFPGLASAILDAPAAAG